MLTKTMNQCGMYTRAIFFGLLLVSVSANASHRSILFNETAMDKVLEMWPDFVESVNNQARGVEQHGERGLITQSPLRAHLGQLLREQPTPEQYAEGFRQLINESYIRGGMTTFGSRLNTNQQITAYHTMMRKEGRLPIRFAYSLDLARQAIPTAAAAGFYEYNGSRWDTIEMNPWLWLHGMSAEGDWDAPNRGCLQDDLPVKAGVDRREVKEILEICPDFNAPTVQALMRGVRSGWRFAGVHGVGSHAIRLFVQKLEEHMAANPKQLTLEYVRDSRHGFAHGTMTGAVPDVVAAMVKYNLYLPINLRRALDIEPDNCRQNYVEDCFNFIGPVKTLLDAGVKVVGEGGEGSMGTSNPQVYFDVMSSYVNRRVGDDGEIFVPGEAIDRVIALKLFTYRSAEFLYAETKVGSLELGKYADFIVAEKPFLSGPDSGVRDNKVLMTVIAGEERFYNDDFRPREVAR